MTSYESDFDAALNRGRVYDSAEQLRATPEGTPIADAEGRHWIRGFNDPAERRWRRRKAPRLIWVEIGGDHRRCPSSEIPLPATHAATEDFWPTTLVEGSGTGVVKLSGVQQFWGAARHRTGRSVRERWFVR